MKRFFVSRSYSRFALVLALNVCFTAGLAAAVYAQEASEAAAAAEEVSAPPPPDAAAAPAEQAEGAPAGVKMPWEQSVSAEAEEEAGEAAEEAEAVEAAAETPAPAPETAPVIETAAETPAAAPAPAAPSKPEKPKKVKEPKEPKEPSDGGVFRLGVRAGLGTGGFAGHKALIDERGKNFAIILKPSVSASAGLAAEYVLSDLFGVAVEAQYSLYKAHGEYVKDIEGQDYRDLYQAGAVLHSAELPVLARFHLNPVYVEAGVSPGANVYSRIYKGVVPYKPIPNYVACGAVFGVGIELENVLVGVRGHYGFIEYDQNLTGYPWSVRISLTKFFLN